MDKETLQTLYAEEGYYWGTEPNELARQVGKFASPQKHPELIDLGAGEGRDSVYLASLGFHVTAMDYVALGLDKAQKLALESRVSIEVLEGDINTVELPQKYDVVYSIGALQYIEPKRRNPQFEQFQSNTNPNGVHVMFAFINHPEVEAAPDWGRNEYLYQPGELIDHYDGWHVLTQDQIIFDCDSSGVPHRHAADILIVQKP